MQDQHHRLARWNRWANRLVLTVLTETHGEPAKALAAFQHVLDTEITWLRRIEAIPNPDVPHWDIASLVQCESWSVEAEERLLRLVSGLDTGRLAGTFSYRNSRGDEFIDTVADALLHMFLHSMQYRGEAVGFLNHAGHRVPDMDFIFWRRLGEPT